MDLSEIRFQLRHSRESCDCLIRKVQVSTVPILLGVAVYFVPCEVPASKSRISLSKFSSQDKQATRKESRHVSVSVPRRHDRRKDGQGTYNTRRFSLRVYYVSLMGRACGGKAMATHHRSLLYLALWVDFQKTARLHMLHVQLS